MHQEFGYEPLTKEQVGVYFVRSFQKRLHLADRQEQSQRQFAVMAELFHTMESGRTVSTSAVSPEAHSKDSH